MVDNYEAYFGNTATPGFDWGGNNTNNMINFTGSPISQKYTADITPNFSRDFGVYSAPMKDAFSYAGNQMKEGNTMGGLGGLANWGKDKVANTGAGQATKNWWGGMDNADKFGTVMGGIQTAANIYGGYKQLSLANDQFEAQKDMWNKSWAANKKNVNENVQYRAQARHNTNPGKADEDIKKYSL